MAAKTQNFKNHAKIVPLYHRVAFPIFAINLLWSIYRLIRRFSAESILSFLLAVAFVLLFFYARIFALAVQDRVIRLEMRLRLQQVLPPDLRARIPEFEMGQLIAMRFAGDAELPDLARKVLDEKLTDRNAIKKVIRDWQPDFLRA
jgi:Family of unknown function (DUF6526)